jgi:hypothetical protein
VRACWPRQYRNKQQVSLHKLQSSLVAVNLFFKTYWLLRNHCVYIILQATLARGSKPRGNQMSIYWIVQGFSLRRGHFVTLFAPYQTEIDACRMRDDLRRQNPQITYRVVARHAEQA